MTSMAPAFDNGMMDASTVPAKKTYRQSRTIQPEIDPSLPLHPWASTSKQLQSQHTAPASGSTSYRAARKASSPQPAQAQLQPQHAMNMYPPQTFPLAVTPVPAASFYAQPQPALHTNAAYVRATPVPTATSEPQYIAPVPALPKKKLPTRSDLDFLLGGSAKARARSTTPNVAGQQLRPVSATAAPTHLPIYRLPMPEHSVQHDMQAYAAGPSRLSAPAKRSSSKQIAEEHDDDLPLGAEAVMGPDHEAGSSFEADNEEERHNQEKDDPNDRDFRLYDRSTTTKRSRKSQASEGVAADGSGADGKAKAPRKRGRRSLASDSTTAGKVAGSAGYLTPDGPKRRGRPPKEAYTPDVLEQIKAANEMLGIDSEDQEGFCKKRLHEIVDWKTRQALSPEMRKILLRARNTQLQRERLKRIREAKGPVQKKSKTESKEGSVSKSDKVETEAAETTRSRRTKKQRDEEMETASGSAILERAKGKVSEWIKTISSEAEMSNEDDRWGENSVASGRLGGTPPPPAAVVEAKEAKEAKDAKDSNIDPRLFNADDDDQLVSGYFSRFGTVTGSQTNDKEGEGGGAVGDEYYFSN